MYMRHGPVNSARGPFFWPGSRPARHVWDGPGLARPSGAGRAWAAGQARGPARHDLLHADSPVEARSRRRGPYLLGSSPHGAHLSVLRSHSHSHPAPSLSPDSAAIDLAIGESAIPLRRAAAPVQRPRLPSPTSVTSIHQLLSNPNPSPLSNPLSLSELCEFVLSSRPPLRPSPARRRL
jgi:hypothetical protein